MSKDVNVYALSTCIHCKNAKKYLDECGIKYNCVFVDRLAGQERTDTIAIVKEHNPAVSFPTILIGDSVVVGFNKEKIDKALNDK